MEVAWETHQAWDAGNNRPGRDSTEVTRERPGRVRVRVRDELSTIGPTCEEGPVGPIG